MGVRNDVPELLAASDIFCLSSRTEAMPLALAEALATGLPAVVTDTGDMPTMVGECGFVVPPEDPTALADALYKLIALPPRRLSLVARQKALDNFGLDKMVAAYQNLFQSLE
jgi:glycosyltransferase involved in cell wall biosynthesis